MKGIVLFLLFMQMGYAGPKPSKTYLTTSQFQLVINQHTILKKYKNKQGLFRFRKEILGKIKFQNYYFFDTRDLFLMKQGAVLYLINEENGPKTLYFELPSDTKYKCRLKGQEEIIKKIVQGKYPPHLLTEDNCSSNWSHPITELKKFISKKMRRYRPRKGGETLGVNKITLKGKNTIIQRKIPTKSGSLYLEKVLYPRNFIGHLVYLENPDNKKINNVLLESYKISPLTSVKDPTQITLDILENNENIMNGLIKKKIIIR